MRKTRWSEPSIRLLVGLSALAVVFAAYTQNSQQARPPLTIEKVAPDLYKHRRQRRQRRRLRHRSGRHPDRR